MTSLTHPLRIDAVEAPGGGLIGMTLCPGKKQAGAVSGTWDRDLDLDLAHVRGWGAVAVATLMEAHELARYRVERLGAAVESLGMEWHHLPIVDVDVPRGPFEALWVRSGPRLWASLAEGHRVLLHCRGGLGRTGTIAARLLAELGVPARDAVAAVRAVRPGALETAAQVAHARAVLPVLPAVAPGDGGGRRGCPGRAPDPGSNARGGRRRRADPADDRRPPSSWTRVGAPRRTFAAPSTGPSAPARPSTAPVIGPAPAGSHGRAVARCAPRTTTSSAGLRRSVHPQHGFEPLHGAPRSGDLVRHPHERAGGHQRLSEGLLDHVLGRMKPHSWPHSWGRGRSLPAPPMLVRHGAFRSSRPPRRLPRQR